MIMVAYDLETTGINPLEEEIIQIAAAATDGSGSVVETFTRDVRFEKELSPTHPWVVEGLKIPSDRVPLHDAMMDFREFVLRFAEYPRVSSRGAYYNTAIPLTYNGILFDHNFMIKASREQDIFIPFGYPGFDLYAMIPIVFNFKSLDGRPDNFKLTSVCDWYGVGLSQAHQAIADCVATAEIFPHVVDDLRQTLAVGSF